MNYVHRECSLRKSIILVIRVVGGMDEFSKVRNMGDSPNYRVEPRGGAAEGRIGLT